MNYSGQLSDEKRKRGLILNHLLPVIFFVLSIYAKAQPVITSFSPTSSSVGTTVVISGNNFNTVPNLNIVYFGAVRANVIAATANTISVMVPLHATYQPITVTTNRLTAYSSLPFSVRFPAGGSVFSSGSFGNKTDFATLDNAGTFLDKRVIGDIDGDGRPDIVEVNATSQIMNVYRNTSAGGILSFAAKVEISLLPNDASATNIAVGDIDGDGKLDIVMCAIPVQASGGRIWVLKNTSSVGVISFAPIVIFNTIGFDPSSVAVRDLDGDGKTDLLVSFIKSEVTENFKNTSSPDTLSFTRTISISGGRGVAVSDLDNDGKPDVAGQASSFGAPVTFIPVSRNTSITGTPSFGTPQYFYGTGLGPYPLAVADLDGDNKPDMMIITGDSLLGTTHTLRSSDLLLTIIRNTSVIGNISFGPKKDFAFSYGLGNTDLKAVDLDGDGKPDILSIKNDSLSIQKNTSTLANISLDSLSVHAVNAGPRTVDVADMDGDGKADIIVTYRYGFSILRNIPPNIITAIGNTGNNDNKLFSIYPNPAQNSIHVVYPDGYNNADIEVLSTNGKKMLTARSNYIVGNTITINIQVLPKGTFVLSFIKKGKPLITKSFVKM